MAQTITINLPDKLYGHLQRVSELSNQPLEAIVAQSLTHSLPPLLEEIPPEYQPDVYPLLQMDDADLEQETNRVFPSDRWAEYETLLNKKKTDALSPDEEAHLDILRREADILTFRKAYAAVLLKRRGGNPPTLPELERPR